ncbi:MAG TPA: hypothetical protein VGS21_09335, partial [Acidimicrobiales bacterium]|nr:hypothetical protein [Acidimicrobiales bacterium]
MHSTSIVASDELIEHVPEAGSFGLSSDTPRAGSSTGPWLAVGVVAVYVILTILVFLPVSPWDPHSLPVCNCADYAKMTSYLAWTPFALLHGQNIFFTNYQDYPYGVNLAGNTNIPLLGILMAPVTLTAGPIAAMNLVAHIGVASSAASAYFVLRRYVSYWPAAFTGGLLYGFSPYVMAHAHGHPNLIFVPLLPVLVLLADEVLIR